MESKREEASSFKSEIVLRLFTEGVVGCITLLLFFFMLLMLMLLLLLFVLKALLLRLNSNRCGDSLVVRLGLDVGSGEETSKSATDGFFVALCFFIGFPFSARFTE